MNSNFSQTLPNTNVGHTLGCGKGADENQTGPLFHICQIGNVDSLSVSSFCISSNLFFVFPQEPFPVGSNVRSRPGRSRILSWEQNHQDIVSAHTKGGTPPSRGGGTPGYIATDTDHMSVA